MLRLGGVEWYVRVGEEFAVEGFEDGEVFAFEEENLFCVPKACEVDVVDAAELVDEDLDAGFRVRVR